MNVDSSQISTRSAGASFEVLASRYLGSWMAEAGTSLAFSSYQSGKLFLVGNGNEGRLAVFERTFDRCTGLWSNGQTLWMASAFQIWRLENVLGTGEMVDGCDRLYVPRAGYTTGDIDAHELARLDDGTIVFASSLYSCLATLDDRMGIRAVWRPPFVRQLAAEDRCHLNGLGMRDGKARYVTSCGQTDVVDGWRDRRRDGGCVIDVDSDQIILDRLSMPHSPKFYRDRLWLLDSGTGYLGYVDAAAGKLERVCFCPGFARGLAMIGDYAVVAISRPRTDRAFEGLELQDALAARNADARCGLLVIQLSTGEIVHWLRLEGGIGEIFDVALLPGVVRPKALGFQTDEIRRHVWWAKPGY